jgi:hypothetical protein
MLPNFPTLLQAKPVFMIVSGVSLKVRSLLYHPPLSLMTGILAWFSPRC